MIAEGGFVLEGPECLVVLDGMTGKEIARADVPHASMGYFYPPHTSYPLFPDAFKYTRRPAFGFVFLD